MYHLLFRLVIVNVLVVFSFSLMSCGGGDSRTNPLPALPLIDPPKIINAIASDGIVTIDWSSAGEAVKNYQLYFKENINESIGGYQSLNLVAQTKLVYIHKVTNGNQYTYKVAAINKENIEGKKSIETDTVSPIGTPKPPEFNKTLAGNQSNILEWNNIIGLSYTLKYRITGVSGTVTTIDNVISPFKHGTPSSPLTNGDEYVYILVAKNILNLEKSSLEIKLMPLSLPQRIASINIVNNGADITIGWSRTPVATSPDQYGTLSYIVYRAEKVNSVWTNFKAITEQINMKTYKDVNVLSNFSYRYAVAQINQNDIEGEKSPFVEVVPSGTLLATSTLLLTVEPTRLKFTWDVVTGATEYRLMSDNGNGFIELIRLPATIPQNNILSKNIEIAVHKHEWNTSYILQACNASGCTTQLGQPSTATEMLKAIGYFKATNTGIGDQFGSAVSLSKDGMTLAVGALWESSSASGINQTPNDAANNSGAVYVFVKKDGVWEKQAFIKASNTESGDIFGTSVSLSDDGNTLAIGASSEDSNIKGVLKGIYKPDIPNNEALNSGAVYVFARTLAGIWGQDAYIKASNTGSNDGFGESLSLSGDGQRLAISARDNSDIKTIVAGNYDDTLTPNNGAVSSGAVYIFKRNLENSVLPWYQEAFVKPFNTDASDLFGYALALNQSGTSLVVGSRFESSDRTGTDSYINQNNAASQSGAMYVFTWSGAIWEQIGYIKPHNTGKGDQFGFSVSISDDGNTVAAGSFYEDSDTTGINSISNDTIDYDSGAAYVFTRKNTVWSQEAYIKSNNTGKGDFFGWSISLSGDGNTLAVGAPLEDTNMLGITKNLDSNDGLTSSGAAYIFTRNGTTWSQSKTFIKALNDTTHYSSDILITMEFGDVVSLNRDGSKLIVGAHKESSAITITDVVNKRPNGVSDTPNAGAVYLY